MSKTNLDWALGYAELGWPVFRVRPNSKKPYDRWRNGPTYATTDSHEIHKRWAREMPDANIGIETGRVAASGLYLAALDVDRHEGLTPALMSLSRDTYSVFTPSGGAHYYFYTERPVKNSVSALGDGIDVRGAGGMVLAPPSIGATGEAYKIWDDLPVRQVNAAALEPIPTTTQPTERTGFERNKRGEGGRNNYLASAAGAWLAADKDGTSDVLKLDEYLTRVNLEDNVPPLSDHEVGVVALSMFKRHMANLNA